MNERCRRTTAIAVVLLFAATAVVSAMGFPEGQNFEFDRITELEIEAGIFAVEIQGHSGSTTEIEVRAIPRGFVVDARERRGSVEVVVKGRPPVFGGVTGKPRILVSLPVATGVTVDTSTGDIYIEKINSDIAASATTGDIDVRDVAGAIDLGVTTGGIDVSRCRGELTAKATTGDIGVDDFQGVMDLDTTTGDIDVRSFRVTGNAGFSATTGDVDVAFQNAPGDITIDATSTTGDIDVGSRLSRGAAAARFVVRGRTTTGDQSYR